MNPNIIDRPIPRATYRVQLNGDFTFQHLKHIAPYLGTLGISHAYLSPVLKARRGSTHGYDTVDHSQLDPVLGSLSDFETMAATLKASGVGIILDIVPNHMGVGGDENAKWLDVLQWGPHSQYTDWFDINWSPSEPSLKNKVLVPFLGSSFGEALESGTMQLSYDDRAHTFALWLEGTHKLPICPDTYHMIGGRERLSWFNGPEGRTQLANLIEAQYWRPARFSVAADDINYRRFFIVSDLAGIRVERDEVFKEVHQLTFDLVRSGLVDGLRVDHVDGLYDPKAYCQRLREECPRPIYLVVEKILAPHEALRREWNVDGTTGYEFAGAVTRLVTDPVGEEKLTRAYDEQIGGTEQLGQIERDAKRAIMDFEMAAELDNLTDLLRQVALSLPRTVDLTRNAIRSGLREVIACMPVYRTYLDEGDLDEEDRRNLAVAITEARVKALAVEPAVFDFLNEVMTAELCRAQHGYDSTSVLQVARRIQQYTGPVMAKGLEDTALYRYNRLIALSDVGEKPDRFATSIGAFHDLNRRRLREMPYCMLTTSSHDTKRGEDTRARVAALSGFADAWTTQVKEWRQVLREAGAPEIDPNDSYYFFQLLVGAWPTTLRTDDDSKEARQEFRRRIEGAMQKSVREARLRTSWSAPRTDYEDKVRDFIGTVFSSPSFLNSFLTFEALIATSGAQNGLIETVLKLTVPGVPDIYQGAEFWEQSMVDPDNRRAVDFGARELALGVSLPLGGLIASWRDGRIKQRIILQLLQLRKALPLLFSHGSYEPIDMGKDMCVFQRQQDEHRLIVAVHLYPWKAMSWDRPALPVPEGIRDLFSTDGASASVSHFARLPVGVFTTWRDRA